MRPIKFRIWSKGYEAFMGQKDDPMIGINHSKGELFGIMDGDYYKLNAENYEVMQFTGLHDKNGKEIYEGDIVAGGTEYSKEPFNSEVKWEDILAGFEPFVSYDIDCNDYYATSKCEVIGNIYENADLLK